LRLAGIDGTAGDDAADALHIARGDAARGGAVDDARAHLRHAAHLRHLCAMRCLRNLHGAPADQRTPAGAGTKFRQSHSDGHDRYLFPLSPTAHANEMRAVVTVVWP
jgi:hypothetical protein